MKDTFDLTIRQCDAGPGKKKYVFTSEEDSKKLEIDVRDVSTDPDLNGGHRAILIHFGVWVWLYQFESKQFNPQEPKLFINSKNELSIQGAGKLKLIEGPPPPQPPNPQTEAPPSANP